MENTFNLKKYLAEGKLLEEETSPIELKIQKLIDQNFKAFSQLGDSEVSQFELNEIPSDIVAYLKTIERFDYKNIVIYYVEDKNQIWVENTGAELSKGKFLENRREYEYPQAMSNRRDVYNNGALNDLPKEVFELFKKNNLIDIFGPIILKKIYKDLKSQIDGYIKIATEKNDSEANQAYPTLYGNMFDIAKEFFKDQSR